MINPGRPVKDMEIDSDTSIEKIFEEMSQSGGFESVNMSNGLDILTEMISDKQCLRFVSFVGAVVSTGLRGIIKNMIKNKWFDVSGTERISTEKPTREKGEIVFRTPMPVEAFNVDSLRVSLFCIASDLPADYKVRSSERLGSAELTLGTLLGARKGRWKEMRLQNTEVEKLETRLRSYRTHVSVKVTAPGEKLSVSYRAEEKEEKEDAQPSPGMGTVTV